MMRRVIRKTAAGAAAALALTAWLGAAGPAQVADAVMKRDIEAVRELLKSGADVNAAQGDGMTALHWAARSGDAELTQMLIFAGANVKASTRLGGYTPLMMAAEQGHAPVIAALIAGGADVKDANATGTTPLMFAAAAGDARSVQILVENGSEIDAVEKSMGQTALMFAAAGNRVDAINALIKGGASLAAATKVVDLAKLTSPDEEDRGQGQAQRPAGAAGAAAAAAPQGRRGGPAAGNAGIDRPYRYNELIERTGGMSPLLLAARGGFTEAVKTLVAAGADVNQVSKGDETSPLLIATINGHFDLAKWLLDQGADPNAQSINGVAPLFATLNVQWAPRTLYPQPRAFQQQQLTYLDFMKALLEKGANPDTRVNRKVWYSGYNFDLAGVDEIGATPFWRAAYASDVAAMQLLMDHGADPNIPSIKPAGRPRTGDGGRETTKDVSGLPPVPVGGPGVTPLQAAAGVGYGEGFAANSHIHAPGGFLPAVKFLVEVAGADVNAADHEGNTALHHAAARGDDETILYLVSKGADVTKVNREGQTVADMANGPVQRVQPFPETLKLLEKLGSKNNNKCVSC
jgi:ankyrin repeat protein